MNLFQRLANYVSGFFKDDLEPWIVALCNEVKHDVATAIVPFGEEALDELVTAGTQFISGTPAQQVLSNALVALEATGMKAIAAGVAITEHDLLTATAAAAAAALAKTKLAASSSTT